MTAPALALLPPEEARCPEHPDVPSVAPCARCGRFMCGDCNSAVVPGHCSACAAIAGDPHGILAEPFSAFGALGRAFRMIGGTLKPLSLLVMVQSVIAGSFTWWLAQQHLTEMQLYQAESVVDLVVWLVVELAAIALFVGYAEGRPLTLGSALRRTLGPWRYALAANVQASFTILMYAVLLLVPGVMKAMSLMLVTPVVYRELRSDPLKTSTHLTDGHRWPLFGMFLLLFGSVSVVGFVHSAVVEAAADLLLYDRWPWLDVALTIAFELVYRTFTLVNVAFILAAYYGLKRTKGEALPALAE